MAPIIEPIGRVTDYDVELHVLSEHLLDARVDVGGMDEGISMSLEFRGSSGA